MTAVIFFWTANSVRRGELPAVQHIYKWSSILVVTGLNIQSFCWCDPQQYHLVIPARTHTHTHAFNGPFYRDYLGAGTRKVNQSGFYWSKRQWVAVASAGPYASRHLAPDRRPRQHPTTQFLQAGCASCHPTNSVKALKVFWSYHRKAVFPLLLTHWLHSLQWPYLK